jgi:hypothetical protein
MSWPSDFKHQSKISKSAFVVARGKTAITTKVMTLNEMRAQNASIAAPERRISLAVPSRPKPVTNHTIT